MKVYFFPKRMIQAVLVGVCCLLVLGVVWMFWSGGEATVMADCLLYTSQKISAGVWGNAVHPLWYLWPYCTHQQL